MRSLILTLKQRATINNRLQILLRFASYLGARDIAAHAATLTFTSLLAVVPLIAVSLGIVAGFPFFDQWLNQAQDFVFVNFVPAAGSEIQAYLLKFASATSKLTATGTLFLLVTSLLLMREFESVINRLWQIKQQRSWPNRLLLYWTSLTLGPLLIGASLAASSYILSIPLFDETQAFSGLKPLLLKSLPLLAELLVFSLAYKLVPNGKIPLRHAFAGGAIAALLFEVAKWSFAFYITQFPTYQTIYGAISVFPIFLIWIYLSWWVLLLGASFTAFLGISHGETSGRSSFLLACRLLIQLNQSQQKHGGMTVEQLMNFVSGVQESEVVTSLVQLEKAGYVHEDLEARWYLSLQPQSIIMYGVLVATGGVLPKAKGSASVEASALVQLSGRLHESIKQPLSVTLDTLSATEQEGL